MEGRRGDGEGGRMRCHSFLTCAKEAPGEKGEPCVGNVMSTSSDFMWQKRFIFHFFFSMFLFIYYICTSMCLVIFLYVSMLPATFSFYHLILRHILPSLTILISVLLFHCCSSFSCIYFPLTCASLSPLP